MDKEEIIRRLKRLAMHSVHVVGELPYIMSLDDGIALDEAVRLLKEQEAIPIAHKGNMLTGLPVAICPKCGRFARQFHMDTPGEETKFCPYCGQAVKWDGNV